MTSLLRAKRSNKIEGIPRPSLREEYKQYQSPLLSQKEDMVVNLLASGLGAALARLLMLRVLYRTLRGALRKAACRADGLEGMTTISTYIPC